MPVLADGLDEILGTVGQLIGRAETSAVTQGLNLWTVDVGRHIGPFTPGAEGCAGFRENRQSASIVCGRRKELAGHTVLV